MTKCPGSPCPPSLSTRDGDSKPCRDVSTAQTTGLRDTRDQSSGAHGARRVRAARRGHVRAPAGTARAPDRPPCALVPSRAPRGKAGRARPRARAPWPAPRTCGRAGRGRGGVALSPPTRPEPRELRRNRAARPQRPGARRDEERRRQWERHWRGPRSPGPGGDRRPRHELRSRTPRCAARGPRRAASASPGPRPGTGDELPRLRMMVDCQVSRRGALQPWV